MKKERIFTGMSIAYQDLTPAQAHEEYAAVKAQFDALQAKHLKLNMARGKPGKEQLDLVSDILSILKTPEDCISDGVDARNYGELAGLKEAREFWADVLGCRPEECFIGGNASLTLMYDLVSKGYTHGLARSEKPWCRLDTVKWLCPAPGYDRHFGMLESLGIEMITVEYLADGQPDIERIEELARDPELKGIICVPKYSNPTGVTYSREVVRRLAKMECAAPDFRIIWDNAYCVHDIYSEEKLANIFEFGQRYGTEDRILCFTSTSKITFPGSGVAAMALSPANMAQAKKLIGIQTISFDKLNQLRHVRFFKDIHGMVLHMRKHADILRPKFETVLSGLKNELGGLEIGSWLEPRGGYFISFDSLPGCAKAIVAKAKEAGVVMTDAGATFPYGKDPQDSNIRIAPSYPTPEELKTATEIFVLSVKLVSIDKILEDK